MLCIYKKNYLLQRCVDDVVRHCLNTNSDVLTKGRQTFCPFINQSVTAAQAYENAYTFLSENTGEVGFGVFEWVQAFLSLFDKESISYMSTEEQVEEKMKYNRVTKQHVFVQKKVTKRVNKKSTSTVTKKGHETTSL